MRPKALKPCPCCGGAAKEVDRVNANTVTCQSCGLQVKQSAMGMGDAAERWNHRPNEDYLLARVNGLREALSHALQAWHYDGVSDEHGSTFTEAGRRCAAAAAIGARIELWPEVAAHALIEAANCLSGPERDFLVARAERIRHLAAKRAQECPTEPSPETPLEEASRQRNLFAEAIHAAVLRLGIVRTDAALTGPQLLALCDDMAHYAESLAQQREALRQAGNRVIRYGLDATEWEAAVACLDTAQPEQLRVLWHAEAYEALGMEWRAMELDQDRVDCVEYVERKARDLRQALTHGTALSENHHLEGECS